MNPSWTKNTTLRGHDMDIRVAEDGHWKRVTFDSNKDNVRRHHP